MKHTYIYHLHFKMLSHLSKSIIKYRANMYSVCVDMQIIAKSAKLLLFAGKSDAKEYWCIAKLIPRPNFILDEHHDRVHQIIFTLFNNIIFEYSIQYLLSRKIWGGFFRREAGCKQEGHRIDIGRLASCGFFSGRYR